MAELKTKPTQDSVDEFIDGIMDDTRRDDCRTILRMMRDLTGEEPSMWGAGIVGFGTYQYRYESGKGAVWFRIGFSPRNKDLTLYIMPGVERYPALLKQIGRHRTGRSCLYLRHLADIDQGVLRQMMAESLTWLKDQYGEGAAASMSVRH